MRAVEFVMERQSEAIDEHVLLEDFTKRVMYLDEKYNIFITLVSPSITKRGGSPLLLGIPIAVNDNIVTKGIRTTCASRVLERYVPTYDATVIERIKDAGGVLVGKTNMDEFGMGALGNTSAFGPTLNPLNPLYSPGGSSSGSAVAVATGAVPMALGSDAGGSIRLPASWTGIYALKPTYGLVSRYGLISYSDSMDQIGPMTRSIFDLELLFGIIMGKDEKDATTYDKHIPGEVFIRRAIKNPSPDVLRETRAALIRNSIAHPDAHEGIVKRFMYYVDKMRSEGAVIDEVELPLFEKAPQIYHVIAYGDSSSNLARYTGLLYGERAADIDKTDMDGFLELNRGLFGWEVKKRIMLGSIILSSGYYDMYYGKAIRARAKITEEVLRLLSNYDMIITPGSNIAPLPIDFDISDISRLNAVDASMVIANLTGLPALVVPLDASSFPPVSIQIISHKWSEDVLFEVGKFIALYITKGEVELRH